MLKNFQFASPLTCFGAVTSPFLTATQSEISATANLELDIGAL
jgi:hypothetical protein